MSRQISPSAAKIYGLQRVTRIWGLSRATICHHRHRSDDLKRERPGPPGTMSDQDLVRAIRQLLQDSPFHGEGYRKLWARLRFKGIRTSRRRVLRLLREHGLLAHQRAGRPRGSRAHEGRITTDRVDLMWGTDLTSVMTGEGQAPCSELARAALTVTLQSSRSIIARPSASVFTPAAAPIASRHSSRSAKPCASASVGSPRTPPATSRCATITARST